MNWLSVGLSNESKYVRSCVKSNVLSAVVSKKCTAYTHKEMRVINFPFPYEDRPKAVIGVK